MCVNIKRISRACRWLVKECSCHFCFFVITVDTSRWLLKIGRRSDHDSVYSGLIGCQLLSTGSWFCCILGIYFLVWSLVLKAIFPTWIRPLNVRYHLRENHVAMLVCPSLHCTNGIQQLYKHSQWTPFYAPYFGEYRIPPWNSLQERMHEWDAPFIPAYLATQQVLHLCCQELLSGRCCHGNTASIAWLQ